MERSGYNSDVSDKQWERLQEYLPELSTRGAHLRKWELRVIINAILYVVTTGCQWRMLPKDFPPWQSVYYHYSKWCKNRHLVPDSPVSPSANPNRNGQSSRTECCND